MKKLILLIVALTAATISHAQNTVTLPSGTSAGIAKFRIKGTLTDSLNKSYWILFDGGAYNELYTGTYINKNFLRKADYTAIPSQTGNAGKFLTTSGSVLSWATGAAGLSASNFVYDETPSGTINGTNVTFTLANTPTTGTVRLYKNGLRLATTEYSMSGSTITYTIAPSSTPFNDTLTADYLK